jgi:hypothetical protein
MRCARVYRLSHAPQALVTLHMAMVIVLFLAAKNANSHAYASAGITAPA